MNLAVLSIVLLLSLADPLSAEEASERSILVGRSRLAAGQVVQGDYIAFGPQVRISGTVNGDLYAAGGEVVVDGTINGVVSASVGAVTISGAIAQDARVIGGQVTIGGTVGRNLAVAGGDIRLAESSRVHDNFVAAGGEVELAGHVGRDAKVAAGMLTIANGIEHDAVVAAASIRLTQKAAVAGKLRYWSESAPAMDEGATVRGGLVRRPLPEWWNGEYVRHGLAGIRFACVGISFVSTLILGLLLIRLYPRFTGLVSVTISSRPLASAGWGIGAMVGLPILAVLCMVTLLGMPLGLVLFALYMVALYLARIYVMTWFGQLLLRRPSDDPSLAAPFVLGLLLYSVLSLVPYLGGVLTIGAVVIGLGSLLMTKSEWVSSLRARGEV
ncbi:MAG: hypothetical protein U0231_04090 [Nitrospiraceae bacterium]